MSVADAMVAQPAVHPPWTTVAELRAFFADAHMHMALLVDEGELVGTIERPDLAAAGDDRTSALAVAKLDDRTISPDATAAAALGAMRRDGRRRLAVIGDGTALLGLLCLKASGDGFCSDDDVGARRGLDGVWDVRRTGGALPPMRGIVSKRIEGARGRTIAAGVRLPFTVEGLSLRYPFGLVDELVPDGPDAYDGTATLFGHTVGTFRMTRRGSSASAPPST